jgi:hypothetical protein
MKRILIGLVAVLILIQLIPADRDNPPVAGEIDAPPDVMAVLRSNCYDCHSHETQWPWYSKVAPVSWLVARDVNHGREYVNFSTWQDLPADEQEHTREEILEEIEEGNMPLWQYTLIHRGAEPTPEEIALVRDWVAGQDDQ